MTCAASWITSLTGSWLSARQGLPFERVLRDSERGDYHRPPGKILPLPSLKTEVFLETWLTSPGEMSLKDEAHSAADFFKG